MQKASWPTQVSSCEPNTYICSSIVYQIYLPLRFAWISFNQKHTLETTCTFLIKKYIIKHIPKIQIEHKINFI